jgi:hypothetical protein
MKLSSLEAYEVLLLVRQEISKLATEEIRTHGEGVIIENIQLLRLLHAEKKLDEEYRKQTKREGVIAMMNWNRLR